MEIDGETADLSGTLFWVGDEGGGVSPALVGGLAVAVLASLALAVWRIRRRNAQLPGRGEERAEAW